MNFIFLFFNIRLYNKRKKSIKYYSVKIKEFLRITTILITILIGNGIHKMYHVFFKV